MLSHHGTLALQAPALSGSGAHWNEQEAVRTAARRELPAHWVALGVERLAGISGVSAVVAAIQLGCLLAFVPKSEPAWRELWPGAAGLLGAAMAASLLTFAVARHPRVRPQCARDAGYAYLVVLSFLLGLLAHLHAWGATGLLRLVSPVALPILAFSALVPASSRTSLAVSLGAASMDPLAMYVLRARLPSPQAHETALLLVSAFLAALIACSASAVIGGVAKASDVGSYRLVERLGAGGMAEVWRAEHRLLGRPAAVKLLRPQLLVQQGPRGAERLVRLFVREARATAVLRFPHNVQVYDFGIARDGAFYYAMELLDGVDLERLVVRFGPQAPERVVHLLVQVCRALDEAHGHGLVHRDIKPSNVFACLHAGTQDFVKVLDFGLVQRLHPTPEEIDDERDSAGTPAVSAPEMLRAGARVDARADIYAVGCVAYWLITGQRVFEAESGGEMLAKHAGENPVPPSIRLGRAVHPGLEAVVMSCLEKDPERRPQTARELGESLEALSFGPGRASPWAAGH
jgi:serine/threonine-protein kinase